MADKASLKLLTPYKDILLSNDLNFEWNRVIACLAQGTLATSWSSRMLVHCVNHGGN